MREKEFAARQHKALDTFYRDMFAKSSLQLGYWMVTGIMVFGLVVLLMIPYQEHEGFSIYTMLWLGCLAGISYIQPYTQYKGKKAPCPIYDKLKYLPVSREIFRSYRYRKLFKFLSKLFVVCLAGQLFFSVVFFHEVVWANIWYPFVFAFLGPMAAGMCVGVGR